jgi:hypothetical protein
VQTNTIKKKIVMIEIITNKPGGDNGSACGKKGSANS